MDNTPDWYRKHFPKQAQDADKIYSKLDKSGWLKVFRKGWALPENGCSSYEIYLKWYSETIIRKTNEIHSSKSFIEMKDKLRTKILDWANDKTSYSEIEKYQFEINLIIPNFRFDYDIHRVMTSLKIPQHYEAFVHSSFIYKKKPTSFPLDKEMPKIDFSFDPETGRKRLFVEVFADTKIKDFEDKLFQDKLKEHQEKLYDYGTIKQVGIKNLDVAEMVYNLFQIDNKSYKEIRKITGVKDVATMLKRYRKRIGIVATKKQK